MAKMHENELEIDEHLIRSLLIDQYPQWANLPLSSPIKSNGTDNTLFRLGSDYIVRLPRIEWEQGDIATKLASSKSLYYSVIFSITLIFLIQVLPYFCIATSL